MTHSPAAPPGITRPPWSAGFPADWQTRLLTVITEGAPFSRACTPLPTRRGAIAFGILDVEEPAWGVELSEVPDLSKDQSAYEVATSRLSGSILVSQESIDDGDWPLTAQVSQVLNDTFSVKLDRDMIGAAGPHPIPAGILSVAAAADGEDLELATIEAKASIAKAGGLASHVVLNPDHLAGLEGARDDLGRRLYDDPGTSFAGLTTVQAPAATQPFVFARDRTYLVINRDFSIEASRETDSAWKHYGQSIRIVARFALAVPQPSKAARKLTVAGSAPSAAPAKTGSSKSKAA